MKDYYCNHAKPYPTHYFMGEDCENATGEWGAWRAIYADITGEECWWYFDNRESIECKGLIGWYWYAVYPSSWLNDLYDY